MARNPYDVRIEESEVYFLPVTTRMPLKFGAETVTSVTCARVKVKVSCGGRTAEGWGETPLSVTWVWPSALPYEARHVALKQFTLELAKEVVQFQRSGHPIELGYDFQHGPLKQAMERFNAKGGVKEPMPWLAALVCFSAFDLAVHDAYGKLYGKPAFETYTPEFMSRDLGAMIEPASEAVSFKGKYPSDYLVEPTPTKLRAWHLIGGLDPLSKEELTGKEPEDEYPVLLEDWIRTDGLKCLKIKLRGNDAAWDYDRTVKSGEIAIRSGVEWLSADFNCTVKDPEYVNRILDKLRDERPRIYGMILYVEQPFPYELEKHRIDVHSVAARKPLFLDESAHDWEHVRMGRELGWTGVALKTCKTLTGALLSAAWAKAHGMMLMVQDLTNPMLAQIPHVQLAAQVGTIMGVETNAMQFYPEASSAEAQVHPGLYRRRNGEVDLSTIRGPGLGYRLEEIRRELPAPAISVGE